MTDEEFWTAFWAWVNEHNRKPIDNAKDEEEAKFATGYSNRKQEDSNDPNVLKMDERFPHRQLLSKTFWTRYWAFIDKHDRLPGTSTKEERSLMNGFTARKQKNRSDPDVLKVEARFPLKAQWTDEEFWTHFWAYVEEHNYMPSQDGGPYEDRLYQGITRRKKTDPNDPNVLKALTVRNRQHETNEEFWAKFWAFIDKHGRKPTQGGRAQEMGTAGQKEEGRLYHSFWNRRKNNPNDPEVLKVEARFPTENLSMGSPEWLERYIHSHGNIYPRRGEISAAEYGQFNNLRSWYREGNPLKEEDFQPEVWKFITMEKGRRNRKLKIEPDTPCQVPCGCTRGAKLTQNGLAVCVTHFYQINRGAKEYTPIRPGGRRRGRPENVKPESVFMLNSTKAD